MKNSRFLFILITSVLFGCQQKPPVFKCNVDEKYGWTVGYNAIFSGESYSGSLCSKVDSINPYSFGYTNLLKQIGNDEYSKIEFSAWVKVEKNNSEITLVAAITSDYNQNKLQWVGISAKDNINTPNVWVQLRGEISIPNKLPPDAQLYFYGWSPNGEVGYFDDFELSFR